ASSRPCDRRGAKVAGRRDLRHRGKGLARRAGEGDLTPASLARVEVALDDGALALGERAVDVLREQFVGVPHDWSSDALNGASGSRVVMPIARASATRPRCTRDFTVPIGTSSTFAICSYAMSWRSASA